MVPVGRQDATPHCGLNTFTRGAAMSTTLFSGVCIEDICMTLLWTMPCPFRRFYLSDMSSSLPRSMCTELT